MKTPDEVTESTKELPEELQTEVRDFARFLMENRVPRPRRKLRQDWAGGLREFRDKYTSHELQKKASEWMEEAVRREL